MSIFSTSGSGQLNTGGVVHKLVLGMEDGKKGLIRGAAHEFDLAFQQLYLTSETGVLSLLAESDLTLQSNAGTPGNIIVQTSSNGNIQIKRNASLLAAYYNDAFTSGGVGGSGHSAFVYGGDSEATLDDDVGSYLDNSSAAKRIDFSIGSPTTALNFYVGGNAEVKGHFEGGTSGWLGQAHFKNGVLIDTSGTLAVDVTSDFSAQVVVSLTDVPTNATDGALVVAGGISIGANGGGNAAIFADGNVTITGDLTVQGSNTIVETTTLSIEDPIIELARTANNAALTVATTYDTGIRSRYHDGTAEKDLFFGYDLSEDKFTFFAEIDDAEAAGPVVNNGVLGNVKFGEIHTDKLSGATIPFYSANGLAEIQVSSGGGTASLIQASTGSATTSFVKIFSEVAATNQTTGAFQVAGGVGIGGDLYADNIFATTNLTVGGLTADRLALVGANGQLVTSDLFRHDLVAETLSIFDGTSQYAMFDGGNRRLVTEGLEIPGFTNAGALAFSDANGIFSEDVNLSWNGTVLSVVGGASLTADIDMVASPGANQSIKKLTADANDLVIERHSDSNGAKLKLLTQNINDAAGAIVPDIEIKTQMAAGHTSVQGANVGMIRLESGKEHNTNSGIELVAPNSGLTIDSGRSVEITSGGAGVGDVKIDSMLASVSATTNMIQGPANSITMDLEVGDFGSSELTLSLMDKFSGESGAANPLLRDGANAEVIKPLVKTAWGLSLTPTAANDPLASWDLASSRSDGILHSQMTAIGGGAVDQPELYFNGEKIVGWNGTQYALAGSSMQAVYDESATNGADPMIQLDGTNPLSIRVGAGATGEFKINDGPNAVDAILRAADSGLILGSAGGKEISFDGLVNTNILFADASSGSLGYEQSASAGTKSVTIMGHKSSGAQSGDIVLSPGDGPGAGEEGSLIVEQDQQQHILIYSGITCKAASIRRGIVVDCSGSVVDVSSAGSYKGVLGVAIPSAGGVEFVNNDKMQHTMAGSLVYVQEQTGGGGAGNISDAGGVGVAAPAGTRIFLSDQQDGKVTMDSPVGVGDRVVQFGYLVDGTAVTINGDKHVLVLQQVQDEGEIF